MVDTHAFVLELRAVGFTEAQAAAVTRVMRKMQDIDLRNHRTKSDSAAPCTAAKDEFQAFKRYVESALADIRRAQYSGQEALRLEAKEAEYTSLKRQVIAAMVLEVILVAGTLFVLLH